MINTINKIMLFVHDNT